MGRHCPVPFFQVRVSPLRHTCHFSILSFLLLVFSSGMQSPHIVCGLKRIPNISQMPRLSRHTVLCCRPEMQLEEAAADNTFITSLTWTVSSRSSINALRKHPCSAMKHLEKGARGDAWRHIHKREGSSLFFICSLFHQRTVGILFQTSLVRTFSFCFGHVLLSVLAKHFWVAFSHEATFSQFSG